MTIGELNRMEPGAKGIDIEGKIKLVFSAKMRTNPISKKKDTNQFCVIEDTHASIGMNLVNIKLDDSYVGKKVIVKNGSLRGYKDKKDEEKLVLDVIAPEGALILQTPETIVESLEKKDVKPVEYELFEYMGKVIDLMTLPASINMLKVAKEAGWSSEDVRALMVTCFLDAQRRR